MNKIHVLIEDSRIRDYLYRWAPLTEPSHLWGLHRTILVSFFANALFDADFVEVHPLANRYSEAHFVYAERIVGNTTLLLLRVFGQCPTCTECEFDILPHGDADRIELVLCRSCGSWLPNSSEYEWHSLGGLTSG